MKTSRTFKTILVASLCALALAFAVGCSGQSTASSSAASGSSSAASSASAASSEAASSEAASSASADASSAASSAASASASASSASAGPATADEAIAAGYQVFEGTAHVGSAEDIIALQGSDIDPAVVGSGGTYAIVVFDSETPVTGQSGDGTGELTENAKMMGVAEYTDYGSFVQEYGDLDTWRALDGQKVKIAAKADKIMFPSDVRIPIGQPYAKEVFIL